MVKYLERINKIIPIHQQVAGFNPAVNRLYPVVIAEGALLSIYDVEEGELSYRFIKDIPSPMPIPAGVRAAFPLEDYGGRIACVVSPDIFDDPGGYVTILHEFVHCYQSESCEEMLKQKLDVANHARSQGDMMWEIQHPFPYSGVMFIRAYERFLTALFEKQHAEIVQARQDLMLYLGLHDFEYLVWQEWKEGFARWVENKLQKKLGLIENLRGIEKPYSRVTFYAGGAAYIDYLNKQTPGLVNHLPYLFQHLALPMTLN